MTWPRLTRTFAELLIDCEEDRTLRAVLVGMLRDDERPVAERAGLTRHPLHAARALPWHDRARPEARLSRRGWIVVGAVGGFVSLELASLLLATAAWPDMGPTGGLSILVVAGVTGLAIGAFLGARAPSWPLFARRSIVALLVASLGSVVGGSISLFGELTTLGAHGLAAFVKGAIVGGLLGLILVGAVSWAEASSGSS